MYRGLKFTNFRISLFVQHGESNNIIYLTNVCGYDIVKIMKTEIDQKGKLTIWPENEIESYALSKWSDDYFKNCECTGKGEAVFAVNLTVITDPLPDPQ